MTAPSSQNDPIQVKSGSSSRDFWLKEARKTAFQVNAAWWLEFATGPLLIASLIGAAAILLTRNFLPDLSPAVLWSSLGGLISLIAFGSWFFASRRFEKPETSLVRIEAEMGLHNSLSAANVGIGPWPSPTVEARAGLRWHWPRLIIPPLAAIALLSAGLLIPVSSKSAAYPKPEEPQAWLKLESQLDQLEEKDVVNDSYLDEMKERLEQLRAQKEEEWFSHSSLEATDTLEKSHESEMKRMQRDLESAENALSSLDKNAQTMTEEQKSQLLNDYQQALQSLENGSMKPNPKLLEQMKQLDPSNLGQLSQEQLQQLRENMRKHQQAMKDAQSGESQEWQDELLDGEDGQNGEGQGDGDGDGKPGGENGKGGVARGPGHSPGVLGKEKDAVETGDLTGLQAKDLSNAIPGDLLQLQNGEHDVDTTPSKISSGGNTTATGSGGDRVWQDSLDPDEQRTLKKFFE
ncbi:hypothetical protein JIN85_00055 [Luteolibacter pohnpeiensis]|uniref:Uncharacterized protein n=1 Tax=Luteolibacter pohnpeiensis TaxID=454153 RepID=A0A934S1R6_9BACT|nr:hypothetical protein [Luteolibacter pohnpeiensis]MBK1880781.1 hypothetical protein [Luteolibacter pohnpeiensis]